MLIKNKKKTMSLASASFLILDFLVSSSDLVHSRPDLLGIILHVLELSLPIPICGCNMREKSNLTLVFYDFAMLRDT